MSEKMNEEFLQSVADVLERARKNAKAAIDLSMVYAYFETGRLIVEEEQNGLKRAALWKISDSGTFEISDRTYWTWVFHHKFKTNEEILSSLRR